VEHAHDGDLAGCSERPLDNRVDDDVGKPWNHQLTRPLDPTRAATPRLLCEGSHCTHEESLDQLGSCRVVARDLVEDLE
jgi:hypothetical protein